MPYPKNSFVKIYRRIASSRNALILAGVLLCSLKGECQTPVFLPAYTRQAYHFGFIIAMNTANFYIDPKPNLAQFDTLRTIRSVPQRGFDLGIVSEWRFQKYLRLRFVPSLGFSDRQIAYNFVDASGPFTVTKDIQSVFLNFPVDVKLISKRQKNFEAYVLAGGKYVTDLASQHDVNQQLAGARATVRINRNDWAYEAGGGIEFYLPFFKFGIEFKLSQGIGTSLYAITRFIQNPYSRSSQRFHFCPLPLKDNYAIAGTSIGTEVLAIAFIPPSTLVILVNPFFSNMELLIIERYPPLQ